MTSFARIEEKRLFLERCDRLYQRVQYIKARVDNSAPMCMYGSYLGKRNELRKSLTSAGSARTQSSSEGEIEILGNATIEQKIERFFVQINYKNTPRTQQKRFPYLKQPARIESAPEVPTDLIDAHAVAFTPSYPRILRHHGTESKLRQMPWLYQKVGFSSSEEISDKSATASSDEILSGFPKTHSSQSSENSLDEISDEQNPAQVANESKSETSLSESDPPSKSTSSRSSESKSKKDSSSVSTASSEAKHQATSISTKSSETLPSLKRREAVRKLVLQMPSSIKQESLKISPERKDSKSGPVQSPQEDSNADTTHGIPPMDSTANSPLNEDDDPCMKFLNDVTDVILGMNMFSPSAIDAAIDAILATNLYGDLDKERARLLVEQLFI